ncbi:hypothetical protein ACFFGV_03370 [Pontibacillus salicampi]|uniref:Competence protein ComG n=1 Tax=Pontibacillus salicampi TaxID=1449801 RepID=A0ABV6LJQ8_9BACI
MRKRSSRLNNNSGDALPLLLVILTFLFFLLSVLLYEHKHIQAFTTNEKELIRLNTLFQMTTATAMDSIYKASFSEQQTYVYSFPYGEGTVKGHRVSDGRWRLVISVETTQHSKKAMTLYRNIPY